MAAFASLASLSAQSKNRMQHPTWARCGNPLSASRRSPPHQASKCLMAASKYRWRASGTRCQLSAPYFAAPNSKTATICWTARHGSSDRRGFPASALRPSWLGWLVVIILSRLVGAESCRYGAAALLLPCWHRHYAPWIRCRRWPSWWVSQFAVGNLNITPHFGKRCKIQNKKTFLNHALSWHF